MINLFNIHKINAIQRKKINEFIELLQFLESYPLARIIIMIIIAALKGLAPVLNFLMEYLLIA